MKFKTYDLLSQYILGEDGSVIEVSTGEALKLTSLKNYLLQTDELAGDCQVALKRRFTKDEIVKMFNSPKAKDFKEDLKISVDWGHDSGSQTIEVTSEMAGRLPEHIKKFPYITVGGIAYQSSRDAAKETGENYNTILRKAKANKEGYFYIEK